MDRNGLLAIILILGIAILGIYYYKIKFVKKPEIQQWNQWNQSAKLDKPPGEVCLDCPKK